MSSPRRCASTQPKLRLACEPVEGSDRSRACGETIGRALQGDDLAGVFVLSDALNVNGSELVAGTTSIVGQNIPVTGGLAGDGAQFRETLVGADCAPRSRAKSQVGLKENPQPGMEVAGSQTRSRGVGALEPCY